MKDNKYIIKAKYSENRSNKSEETTADKKRFERGFKAAIEVYNFDLTKSKFLI